MLGGGAHQPPRYCLPPFERNLIHIAMQFSIVSALIVSFLALAASAAPVPEPAPIRLMQDRAVVEPGPLVGMDNVARAPEPQPLPAIETEEARGCRMYSLSFWL
ncbi:hypothetical protein MKEN_00494000 [Mycena kentingensis (nom. inval.)]|nr:hypothetical protein MKEN_00494000 [Mycena kentingensis (nom. inval.)]